MDENDSLYSMGMMTKVTAAVTVAVTLAIDLF